MTFATYKDDLGVNVGPVPTISEIGGGLYKFTPTMPTSSARGLVYQINTGAGAAPGYIYRYVRNTDWADDEVSVIRKILTNKYQVVGNQLIVFEDDLTTVFKTFNLQDVSGAPSMTSIFRRIPV